MPVIAREILCRRLSQSGLFGRLADDVELLCGVRPRWIHEEQAAAEASCEIYLPLVVGSVQVGYLGIDEALDESRRMALQRWLETALQSMSQQLLQHVPSPHQDALPGSIARAARLLRDRFAEPLSLDMVAEEVGLSRERLSRLFHETLGITYSDYLNMVRLDHARRLLRETNQKVADVAYSSGFQTLSQFNRRFKAAENCSPRVYRQQYRLALD